MGSIGCREIKQKGKRTHGHRQQVGDRGVGRYKGDKW